jgi:hypothetical protein
MYIEDVGEARCETSKVFEMRRNSLEPPKSTKITLQDIIFSCVLQLISLAMMRLMLSSVSPNVFFPKVVPAL